VSGAVVLNWVLGAIIIVLIVGGGIYAAVRHGKAGPDDREARRYLRAKDDPQVTLLGEHVPTEAVAAAGGLAEPRSPLQETGQNAGSGERAAAPAQEAEEFGPLA
jgi:cbb3-type cytochrome oxidase subunit 3